MDNAKESVEQNRDKEKCVRSIYNKEYFESEYYLPKNGDWKRIRHLLWAFSKSLPHNEINWVDKKQFHKLLKGLRWNYQYLEDIQFGGTLRLVNPSSIYSLDSMGPYKANLRVKAPPAFSSNQMGSELVELYYLSLIRDLPFTDWETNPIVLSAVEELKNFPGYRGPQPVTPQTIFRGNNQGDLIGPYISQLFLRSYQQGPGLVTQNYQCYAPGVDYATSYPAALSLQNGTVTEGPLTKTLSRYISTLRDGISYVHQDNPTLPGIQAAYTLWTLKTPWAPGIQMGPAEVAFVDCQQMDVIDLMTRAVRSALLSCWYNKWAYLRVRPEAYAISVHLTKTIGGNPGLPVELLNSPVLDLIYQKYGTYLLPQAYPEGSPVHPAYPAGHVAFAGASITILKAFVDGDFRIEAVLPSADGQTLVPQGYTLRVEDELNKFASNIALLRDAAGVHYRSDAQGIRLGEKVAIEILRQHVKRYPHKTTFKFRRFDGKPITIEN